MVHDWFVHKRSTTETIDLPLAPGDDWSDPAIRIPKTEPDPVAPPKSKRPPAYANLNSHWWDPRRFMAGIPSPPRKCGRRWAGDCASSRPVCCQSIQRPGFPSVVSPTTGGLAWRCCTRCSRSSTITSAICSRITIQTGTTKQLFIKARLINSALMAKIHTVEWTPAIVPHPIIQLAMRVNWSGLAGDELQEALQFLDDQEIRGRDRRQPRRASYRARIP